MFQKVILFCSFLFLTQCASLAGKYDKEKVGKIRSIAVVGFTYDAPLEASEHLLGALLGKEHTSGGGGLGSFKTDTSTSESATSQKIYDDIVANLKKSGWKVKTAGEVQTSPVVKAFYNRSVKIGMLPLSKGTGRFERAGVPQFHHVSAVVGKGEFAKMARDLGVDAIAVAYVSSGGSQTVPMVTKLNHSASVTFQIFDPTSDAMIVNFSNNGKEVDGRTKTKIGKEFQEDVEKGALFGVAQFGEKFRGRLQE